MRNARLGRSATAFAVLLAVFAWRIPAYADVWSHEKMVEFMGYSSYDDEDSPLSRKQIKAVEDYVVASSINDELRSGILSEDSQRMVKRLDSVFKKQTFPFDLILLRGADLYYRNRTPYRDGEEFLDAGYLSSTINLEVAKFFATDAIYVLYAPKRFHSFWIGGYGRSHGSEEEVLIPRNSRFKIMSSRIENGKYIQLVQICQRLCEQNVTNSEAITVFRSLTLNP